MLKAGDAEALLVVKLDRLTRSVVDLGTLVERYFAPGKAALLSVGEQIDTRSVAGRLVLNVLASVSQWEREAIGDRTACVKRQQANVLLSRRGGSPEDADLERISLAGPRIKDLRDLFVIGSGAQTRLRTLSVLTACGYRGGLPQ